jgi:hypothetical protein
MARVAFYAKGKLVLQMAQGEEASLRALEADSAESYIGALCRRGPAPQHRLDVLEVVIDADEDALLERLGRLLQGG